MNFYGVKAIYSFEMSRMGRTLMQSVLSPVISTCCPAAAFRKRRPANCIASSTRRGIT